MRGTTTNERAYTNRPDLRIGSSDETLSEIARCYGERIRRTAYQVTRSESAAQDVTQDVFVRVMCRGGFDSRRGSLEQWVQSVARNTAIDWVRREAAHQRRVARVGSIHSATSVSVEEAVAARAQARIVRTAMAELPDNEREAVELAFFEGFTYRQVATRLELAEGTVKSLIRRGLARLAHIIGPAALAGS